ncbi:MAG TPA: NADH dehydrogenase (quinone) subunit D [Thermoanaerobaculia bacterium]|nr:NADH dehydrogenase (quinone) subunit D [Thermoanaerobaculia bacterium]
MTVATETALSPAAEKLRERIAASPIAGRAEVVDRDLPTIEVDPASWPALARFLRDDPGCRYDLFLDLCGVDNLRRPGQKSRFEAVVHLHSLSRDGHVRVRVRLPDADDPSLPTVSDVWPAANWFEREAFDLYGFDFPGHPNLKRILCHDAFVGHPLRKDYAPGQRWFFAEEDMRMPEWSKETDVHAGHFETQTISIGPSHPATHGIIHLVARLDGERIVRAETMIGYLHRCFEKMAEKHHWNQIVPYCDRLNYVSAMINGVGFVRTAEKMLGIEVPDRGRLARTILSEFTRIMDHCVCIGANLVDIGALTTFVYLYQNRENIYDLLEACCGARLTVSYVRVGGLAVDVPDDFVPRSRALLESIPTLIDDIEKLINNNRIVRNRLAGTGIVTKEQAIAWGLTGPMLRASGVPYDVRRSRPYDFYDRFDWDIPIAQDGDNFARYLVRLEEMRQSLKIIRQALDVFPSSGPVNSDDWRVVLPPKDAVYHDMESLIYHFKLTMEGIRVPAGERYEWIEGANGELGFYAVSDGRGGPYRLKVRPPCFPNMAAFEHIVVGGTVSDAVATLGTLNVIAGELDR